MSASAADGIARHKDLPRLEAELGEGTYRSPSDAVVALAGRALAAVWSGVADPGNRQPADALLQRFLAGHREAGRRDREQIADLVFHALRHLRRLAGGVELGNAGPDRVRLDHDAIVRQCVLEMWAGRPEGEPAPGAAGAGRDPELGPGIRYSLPDWLWQALVKAHGEVEASAIAKALLDPAPIQLRVNLLKARRESVLQSLASAGIDARPIADLREGIDIIGRPGLEGLASFQRGEFEVQDAGSQRLAEFAGARRGQTVVDLCAGGGGKTLAMASRMRNEGRILAFDRDAGRLKSLEARVARAGVRIATVLRLQDEQDPRLARYHAKADVVVVDAPCTGTGTLRRSPDLKWRLEPRRIDELVATQRAILVAAARLVKPGGTLVYATCSLLEEENDGQMRWFSQRLGALGMASGQPSIGRWLPGRQNTDGFFACKWVLKDGPTYNM